MFKSVIFQQPTLNAGAPRFRAWGMDAAARVQPSTLPLPRVAAREAAASNTVRALHGRPTLAQQWRRRRHTGAPLASQAPAAPKGALLRSAKIQVCCFARGVVLTDRCMSASRMQAL